MCFLLKYSRVSSVKTQERLNKKLIPKYANVMVSNTPPASYITSKKTQMIRIKD